ncbi:MAG: hypothetical protein WAU75_02710 [Solirubrobacteraceae bacterium]
MFPFSTVDDASGISNSSDGATLTVATAGTYEISITLIPQASLSLASVALTIDDGGHIFVLPSAVANAPATTTRIAPLAVGDTVAVQNFSGSPITLQPGSTLELVRLGP